MFTIRQDAAVTRLGDRKPEKGEEVFEDAKSLAAAIKELPIDNLSRFLVDTYNGLPGVKTVKKFTSARIGIERIAKAAAGIKLGQDVSALLAKGKPGAKAEKASPGAKARATKGPKAKGKAKAAVVGGAPREGSKGAIIVDALREKGGATNARLMELTGWQTHSVRGFLSTLGKKQTVTVTKLDDGTRVYSI